MTKPSSGSLCNDRCKKCKYHGRLGYALCCDYYLITGKARPGELANDDCLVFQEGSIKGRKKLY